MKFKGELEKDGKYWLATFPTLDIMTQGMSKKEAYEMAADLIKSKSPLEIEVVVDKVGKFGFEVGSNNTKAMIAILLTCLRRKSGLSHAQVAERLGTSRSVYARYEKGRAMPSVEKLEDLLSCVSAELSVSAIR